MSRKLKKDARDSIKRYKGIVVSTSNRKKCKNCYYMNHPGNICSKHFVRVSLNEICYAYNPRGHKIYKGGGVSPK